MTSLQDPQKYNEKFLKKYPDTGVKDTIDIGIMEIVFTPLTMISNTFLSNENQ